MRKFLFISFIATAFILTGCSEAETPQIGPYPATEIFSDEPAAIGYIVDVLEEEQVIFVKSGVTKQEAMELDRQDIGFNMHTFYSNSTTFDGKLKKGYKVAVWKFEEEEGNVHAISEKIIVLEK
ncbi:hypothetical protein [Planococcus salinarum]|uniref:hypothetical protein n=1 Tax=Planococcus salinarum TaxID=622695 RepID=UPI000E3CB6E0|nr:hypothetical protein [Planococcus salinarum]TAA73061.1 hypothetical protein D2909_03225 [Planococcus salinarum]